MGFFGDCWSAVRSFASSIVDVAVSIGSKLAPIAAKLVLPILNVISIVAEVVKIIGILCDVVKPHEKMEEIGEKVLQAGEKGITIESCKHDFKKYKAEIDNFEIDIEKAKTRKPEDQILVGIAYVQSGIKEFSPNLSLEGLYPLIALQKDFFTPNRMKSYCETAMALNESMGEIKSYFDGSCTISERKNIESFLHTAEQKFNPTNYDVKTFQSELGRIYSNSQAYLK